MRRLSEAAKFIDRTGFLLLMPHRGMPMPTLWEGIRGRPGGHPFTTWTKHADLMWQWKDELPAKRLAYYGSIWSGVPGFVSLEHLPCLMKLWGYPPGEDGFRAAYREGRLSFNGSRLMEALYHRGALNTYRLRVSTGINPSSFKRALKELQGRLLIAKRGTDEADTTWPAAVVDITARVFPRADAESRRFSFVEARETALAVMGGCAPRMSRRQTARLLRIGAD